jgi:hypothetical protein
MGVGFPPSTNDKKATKNTDLSADTEYGTLETSLLACVSSFVK